MSSDKRIDADEDGSADPCGGHGEAVEGVEEGQRRFLLVVGMGSGRGIGRGGEGGGEDAGLLVLEESESQGRVLFRTSIGCGSSEPYDPQKRSNTTKIDENTRSNRGKLTTAAESSADTVDAVPVGQLGD